MTIEDRAKLYTCLLWQYGPARARSILLGEDLPTQRDLFLWRRLGEGFQNSPLTD